jgi:hypothetical protein
LSPVLASTIIIGSEPRGIHDRIYPSHDTAILATTDSLIFKESARTSQETLYFSVTKPNRLMLFRETVAVYWENLTEHTDTLCVQNAE